MPPFPRRPAPLPLRALSLALPAALALSAVGAARAQDVPKLDRVDVSGHYDNAVGTSDAASEGRFGSLLIEQRPLLRTGDLLEFVPGLIATQHSGAARPTSTSCAASTSTTAPISRPSSTACRSTCARTATARATPTSTS